MWIKLHDSLPDSPKIVKLSLLTKMDRDLVRAKVERLWLWMLTNRIDGVLSEEDVFLLEDVMRLKNSPQKMVEALVESKLLDPCEGGYRIHDWDEHVGMLQAVKETAKAKSNERVKRYRERQKALHVTQETVTCNALQSVTETVCNAPREDKIRKDKIIDIMTDTSSLTSTREEPELSTAYPQLSEQIEWAWINVMAEAPTEAQVRTVARHSVGMDISAVKYGIELACMYGAANPAAYTARVLNEWNTLGIRTEDAAREWRDAQGGL